MLYCVCVCVSVPWLGVLVRQQFEIPVEEAEWVGLSLEEAVEKQRLLEHKVMGL